MNKKDNFLEAVYYGKPAHVPVEIENIWYRFSFEDIVKQENWIDGWKVGWEIGIEGTVPFPKINPLPDIEQMDDYKFPNPDNLILSYETKINLGKIDHNEKLIMGHMSYFLFERAWALMGMENFLTSLITNPKECHILLHHIADYARRVFDRYLEMDIDAISFSEDLGSQRALMISPAMFEEFFLPEYKFCFENVIKKKKIINFHSCGCITAIADKLAGIGVTILNPVQAKANNIADLNAAVNGKMALMGGIDTGMIMSGTPDEVRMEVIRVIEILKPGGGYICGPDQHLPDMPEENMQMLWKTAAEFGAY